MTKARDLSQVPNASLGFKNRIINGAMQIDQRNAGASVTVPASPVVYGVDRFASAATQASKYTVQRNAGSVTPPVGFTNYLGATSSSAYSVLTGDYFFISQTIEGNNVADLAWGTANAQNVTLSFKVYSSLTGTFGGAIRNYLGNRSYPFTYSVPVANTWTTISITIAGDTTGTWVTDNTGGPIISFGLGVGTTYSGTAGSWAAGNYVTATGATSVVGTNGATFYITGVQLEKGSTATSFDYRPYGTELALCQRYYATSNGNNNVYTSTNFTGVYFPTTMRSAPTITLSTGTAYTRTTTGFYCQNSVTNEFSYTATAEL